MDIEDFSVNREPRARALIPFAVFLVFYLGLSIVSGDFYKVPMPVAFLVASATSLFLSHKASLRSKIELFAHGMGNVDIMVMCLIFILAGAFAGTAKAMGAVDATIQLALTFVPPSLLVGGLFLVACFISLAVGTSVGTIVALAPIAVGLTANLDLSAGLCLGAVVGGAMFGDNLSMISDTTIAATRTQGVEMREKFRANFRIALPAAAAALIVFFLLSPGGAAPAPAAIHFSTVLRVLPYLSVLILALFGVNVMALLAFGTLFAGIVGLGCGSFDFWQFLDAAGKGALSMSETLIVALLAGGLLKVIRYNGGIEYMLRVIERGIHGRRGAEYGIAGLRRQPLHRQQHRRHRHRRPDRPRHFPPLRRRSGAVGQHSRQRQLHRSGNPSLRSAGARRGRSGRRRRDGLRLRGVEIPLLPLLSGFLSPSRHRAGRQNAPAE